MKRVVSSSAERVQLDPLPIQHSAPTPDENPISIEPPLSNIAALFAAPLKTIFGVLQRHPIVVAAVVIGTMPFAEPAIGAPLPRAKISTTVARRTVTPRFDVVVDRHAKGAYFRKISSPSAAANYGVRGEGVLPQVAFDDTRHYVSPAGMDEYRTGPLERPSIYLGGRAQGHELDAGLTWDRVFDAAGHATYTDLANGSDGRQDEHRFVHVGDTVRDGAGTIVARGADVAAFMKKLRPNYAFRPYWRTTNGDDKDWHQPPVGSAKNIYFYPGESFTMSVRVTGKDRLHFEVGGFATDIAQIGFGRGKAQSFKRVNAIDQFYVDAAGERVGREGLDVLPTKTKATGAKWTKISLLSGKKELPFGGKHFTEVHGADTHQNYGSIFRIGGANAAGGESIDITPTHTP